MPSSKRDAYVGMFDILGFKALRASKGTASVAQLYERSLLAIVQHSAAGASVARKVDGRDVLVPLFSATSVDYQVISDTVIFLGKDDTFESFFAVVQAAYSLMIAGFGNGQTPFRGAIGFGDLYNRGEIVVGSAIEDAYEAESAQLWAGTMFTDRATAHASEAGYFERWKKVHADAAETQSNASEARASRMNMEKITWYEVPLKPDGQTRRVPVIDWTLRMYEGAAGTALPASSDAKASIIRQNTIIFEIWARGRRK